MGFLLILDSVGCVDLERAGAFLASFYIQDRLGRRNSHITAGWPPDSVFIFAHYHSQQFPTGDKWWPQHCSCWDAYDVPPFQE